MVQFMILTRTFAISAIVVGALPLGVKRSLSSLWTWTPGSAQVDDEQGAHVYLTNTMSRTGVLDIISATLARANQGAFRVVVDLHSELEHVNEDTTLGLNPSSDSSGSQNSFLN
ncbi:hypothetical protein ABKN59_004885 [Abortiporus biennis]